jgi:glycosyltransferase involved in cell wall biosynthesis
MHPLISIALCTYNPGKYLEPLLESIIQQTWRPLEIVCCDDKSSDGSLAELQKFSERYPGMFKIYSNEKNLGYIKNFEKCLSLCSGEWIAIADHDDIWKPEKIKTLQESIGDAFMIYSDSELIDENGNSMGKKISDIFRLHDRPAPQAFSFYDFIWGHSILIKKQLLYYSLPVPLDMPYDSWLAYTAASVSEIRYCNKVLTEWRQHTGSFSTIMFKTNLESRQQPDWKYQEFLKKKNRIATLLLNKYGDKEFMKKLYDRYSSIEKGFSWKLFFFLTKHQKKLFPVWRRNYLSRLNEFRKMARRVRGV